MKPSYSPTFEPLLELINSALAVQYPAVCISMKDSVFMHDGAVIYIRDELGRKKKFGQFTQVKNRSHVYFNLRIEYPVLTLQRLYRSLLVNDSPVDIHYITSIVNRFYTMGFAFKQFNNIVFSDFDIDLDTLTHYHRHQSQSKNKQFANFFYTGRSQKSESIRNRKPIKKAAKYSSCILHLTMGLKDGKLVPLLNLNIPILSDLKFLFSIDLNTGITEDELSLLLFKYEKCLREQLYQIIRRIRKIKQHTDLGEIRTFTLDQLFDEILISEMIDY